MKPNQVAITGHETLDPSTPEGSLSEFYRAFNNRDLGLMQVNWSSGDHTSMNNPLGGIKRGWAEIGPVYETIFGGEAKVFVEFWDYTVHQTTDCFYAVGRERGELRSGSDRLHLAIRTTRIFSREGERWHQVHHHGSIEESALLSKYQEIVRRRA